MNTGYSMPSRRRLRDPLHPRNRAAPASVDDPSSSFVMVDEASASSSAMPPPSTTATGKKREWNSTIGRNGLGSLPWEQMGPSSSGPLPHTNELPTADFSFRSGTGFPTSTSTASMASMASMPSSSSINSFASFRNQQTPMSASPSSFRTAADPDESTYSARSTIFSCGNRTASAMLRQTSREMQDSSSNADEQPRKRRRGLAGTIVDTALNAALYTGAAALTAYSLWSSWGQSGSAEEQSHHPDSGPQADMGHVISQNKWNGAKAKEGRSLPGGLDEPPPPYYQDHPTASSQSQHLQQPQPQQELSRPSTPQFQPNSVRTRKVFVSSPRSRRRTFLGSKARQSTPRQAMPEAFRSPAVHVGSSALARDSSQASGFMDDVPSAEQYDEGAEDEGDKEEEDENDEMLSRFEAKMAALIAEGQAALNSTPTLQESDLREVDAPSPSLGLGKISGRTDSPFGAPSPFSIQHQQDSLHAPTSSSVARSISHPDQLHTSASERSFLPEPVKRTFASNQGLKHSKSNFDFGFKAGEHQRSSGQGSPFVFGGPTDSPQSGRGSPSIRASRRVTDFGGAGSPASRIPTLQGRKSIAEPRPAPF